MSIPRIIHLAGKGKSISSKYLYYYRRILELHPGWMVCYYDDDAMKQWVSARFPELLDSYNRFPHPVQRCDLFRMLVVYAEGGFYLDMDMYCLRPLDPLCGFGLVLGEEKTLTAPELEQPWHKHALRIANYAFGSTHQHPFLMEFVREAMQQHGRDIRTEQDILETTGPGHFTNFYHEQKDRHPGIHLLSNTSHHCVKRCTPQPSCHFGAYAAHLHFGSWRWQQYPTS